MRLFLGGTSIVLGIVYVSWGMITMAEMKRDFRARGFSWFGAAWVAMTFTCGPHHIAHGLHVLEGNDVNGLVAWSTLIGVPPGIAFVRLRIEALIGRDADRLIAGTPPWLIVAMGSFLLAAGGLVTETIHRAMSIDLDPLTLATNTILVVSYTFVGWFLLRNQVRRRAVSGGWSLSGLTLGAVFPTCALMHACYGLTARSDTHLAVIDVLAVPAAIWFLGSVRHLYHESSTDWSRRPLVGEAGPPRRPAPWASFLDDRVGV